VVVALHRALSHPSAAAAAAVHTAAAAAGGGSKGPLPGSPTHRQPCSEDCEGTGTGTAVGGLSTSPESPERCPAAAAPAAGAAAH
jgi:hypothetical protein